MYEFTLYILIIFPAQKSLNIDLENNQNNDNDSTDLIFPEKQMILNIISESEQSSFAINQTEIPSPSSFQNHNN